MCEEFALGGKLEPLDCPVVSIISGSRPSSDRANEELAEDLAKYGTHCSVARIPRSDHFSVISAKNNSKEVADIILGALAEPVQEIQHRDQNV